MAEPGEPTDFEIAKHQQMMDMHRAQREWDRANVLTETRAQILNEGSKGLILINGGGAAALAAFLQAIWTKEGVTPLLWGTLFGLCFLVVGTAAAALIFVTRYLGSGHRMATHPEWNPWRWWQLGLTALSVSFFLMGMGSAVVGGFVALCTRSPGLYH